MKKRWLALILVVIMCTVVLSGCSGPDSTYKAAQKLMANGDYVAAAEKFESIGSYEDATSLAMYCKAVAMGESGNYQDAISAFETFGDYKDSGYMKLYYEALSLEAAGDRIKAIQQFKTIPLFRDSAAKANSLIDEIYTEGKNYAVEEDFENACIALNSLNAAELSYQDSENLEKYYALRYEEADIAANDVVNPSRMVDLAGNYALLGYEDSLTRAENIRKAVYDQANMWLIAQNYNDAKAAFELLGNYSNSAEKKKEAAYYVAVGMLNDKQYEAAYELFKELGDYKDSAIHTQAFEWICVEEYAPGYVKTTFNENGKKIRRYIYNYDERVEYEYDDNDFLIRATTIEDDGDLDDCWEYTYNEFGLLEKEIQETWLSIYTTEYYYDINGYLVYERTFHRDKDENESNVPWREIEYSNRDDGLVLKSVATYDDGDVYTTEYEYDQDNNVAKKTADTIITYTYDSKGNCTSWKETGGMNRTYSAKYEYDEYGNTVKVHETFYDGDTRETTLSYCLIYDFEKASVLFDAKSVYSEAETLLAAKEYNKAIQKFVLLGDFEDSAEQLKSIYAIMFDQSHDALEQLHKDEMKWLDGMLKFTRSTLDGLGGYKDNDEQNVD